MDGWEECSNSNGTVCMEHKVTNSTFNWPVTLPKLKPSNLNTT